MNDNQKYFEHVVKVLDKRTILEQLAEESSEITKAALKVIRADNLSKSTTLMTYEESMENLIEEINDVRMIISLLKHKYPELNNTLPEDKEILKNQNWKRWAFGLGYTEK